MEIQEIKELIDYCETKELVYFELESSDKKLVFAKAGYNPGGYKDFTNKGLTHIANPSLEEAATNELVAENLNAKTNKDIKNGTESIEEDKEIIQIRSPFVGIVTISEKIIKGDHKVNAKDVLCFIEAMKIYNDIHSPVSGNIKGIYVDDKSIIEYDQLIMDIEVDKP
jgi:acetyl-CoA carboxylase biotin carboxyl carrier protein